MPVDRIVTRGQNPGEVIAANVEAHEKQGHDVYNVFPVQDEILVFWKPAAKRETRTTRPTERRGA